MNNLPVAFRRALLGFGVGFLAAVSTSAQITPPYTTGFESGQGYILGSLTSQGGWGVPQGAADVTNVLAQSGTNSIGLLTSSGRTEITQSFNSFSGGSITFVDFWSAPSVAAAQAGSTTASAGGSSLSLVRLDATGHVVALDGDGSGGGTWVPTGRSIALNGSGQATAWVRFTIRQNYTTKTWDLYLDGIPALHDLGLRDNTQTHLTGFSYLATSLAVSSFDTFAVASPNPLFTDADNDGMEDAWETTHGLNASLDDRTYDLDGDGLTNIEEYVLGTYPDDADADTDGLPDGWEADHGANPLANDAASDPGQVGRTLAQSYANTLSPWPIPVVASGLRAWYRADRSVTKDGSNKVSQWADVSGNNRHAGQTNGSYQPVWNATSLNSLPTLSFAAGAVLATDLTGLQSESTDLSVILVFKPGVSQTVNAALLDLDQGGASGFSIYQPTGLTNAFALEWSPTSGTFSGGAQWVATSSSSAQILGFVKGGAGLAAYLNGNSAASGTVTAGMLTPLTALGIGGHRDTPGTNYFTGELAEILIYNRALTTPERQQIEADLKEKYAIDLSGDQDGDGLTNAQEFSLGTDPYDADTDNDGLGDGQEDALGTDPIVSDLDQVPSFLSGRVLHLKGDAGITTDGSGNVSDWLDQSGNGHHMQQATAGSRPVFVASGINSRPTLQFNGSKVMTTPATTALKPDNITILAVYKQASVAYYTPVIMQPYQSAGFSPPYMAWELGTSAAADGAPVLHTAVGGNWNLTYSGEVTPLNTRVYVAASYDENVGGRIQVNGALKGSLPLTGPISYGTGTQVMLGRDPAGQGINGEIAEVIIYDRVLTPTEYELLGIYFHNRYQVPGIVLPSEPLSVAASAISPTQVDVRWRPGTTVSAAQIYTIERRAGLGSYTKIAETTGLDYVDTGLTANTTYTYRIGARSYAGNSDRSESPSVTTPATGPEMSFAGLQLWLKADVGVGLDSSAQAQIWRDQSGNGHDVQQPTAGSRPTYQATGINGRPALRFNGRYLTGAATAALKPDNITIMGVYKIAGASSYAAVVMMPHNASFAPPYMAWELGSSLAAEGAPVLHNAVGTTWNITSSGTPLTLNTATLVTATYDETSGSHIYVNGDDRGGLSLTGPIGYGAATTFYVGRDPAAQGINGDIAELLVYDRVLSAGEREAAGKYLQAKYQLPGIVTPSAPTSVSAEVISATQINVRWLPGTTTSAGTVYSVERKAGSGVYAVVAETSGLDYFDAGLTAQTTYTYRIKARSLDGASAGTESSTVTTLADGPDLPFGGLRLWLKADSVVPNGGTVASMLDQSGNGHHLQQATVASQPVYEASGINGRPTLKFNGSKFMTGATTAALKPDNISIFAVYKVAAVSTYAPIIVQPHNASFASPYMSWELGASLVTDGAPVLHTTVSATWNSLTSGMTTPLNTAVFVGASYDKIAGSRIYVNGEPKGSVVTSGPLEYSTGSLFYLGRDPAGQGLNGEIAEVMVYDRVLSAAERETIGVYLNRKYAFASAAAFGDFRDSNNDGLNDSINRALGLDPDDLDVDGDGIANAAELAQGTNPLVADTDGDGTNDASDAFPTDPSRWTAPAGSPGDVTPPVLTLTKPANAVLQP